MDRHIIAEKPTYRFLGTCDDCVRPIAVESATIIGSATTIPCGQCGKPVTARRLVAVTTEDTCDGSCMSAVGPNCSCGCGGVNHGRSWGVLHTTLEFQDALEAFRAKAAKKEAAREKRAEQARSAAEEYFAEWLDSLDADEKAAVDWVLSDASDSDFLDDMRRILLPPAKPLTDNQLNACRRIHASSMARKARQELEAATAKPVPLGKNVTVEGEVVSVKPQDSGYGYRSTTYKMLVVGDGWKVWGTVPGNLADVNATTADNYFGLKGKRIRFVAEITLKNDGSDPSFGLAKRPKNAEILPA